MARRTAVARPPAASRDLDARASCRRPRAPGCGSGTCTSAGPANGIAKRIARRTLSPGQTSTVSLAAEIARSRAAIVDRERAHEIGRRLALEHFEVEAVQVHRVRHARVVVAQQPHLGRVARDFDRRLAHREHAIVDAPATLVEAEAQRPFARAGDVDRRDLRKPLRDLPIVRTRSRTRSSSSDRGAPSGHGCRHDALACLASAECRRAVAAWSWPARRCAAIGDFGVHRIERKRLEHDRLADRRSRRSTSTSRRSAVAKNACSRGAPARAAARHRCRSR